MDVVVRPRYAPTLLGLAASALLACSVLPGEDADGAGEAVSIPGRWRLPTAVAAVGADVHLHYDGAPKWNSKLCAGRLKSGAHQLGEYLQDRFGAISSVGGYACRRNTASTSRMSVHGTGRALDVFIPTVKGAADNTRGDAVANWLVANAEHIGVQLVIWDRTVWQANGRNDRPYTGPVPHVDHLHVELTVPASAKQTPWFLDNDGGTDETIDTSDEMDDADASAPDDEADAGHDHDADSEIDPGDDVDAGTPVEPPGVDAGADPDPIPSPTDAGAPPAGGPSDDSAEPDPTPEDEILSDEPIIDDEPAEGESTGVAPRRKKSSSSSLDEGVSSDVGCSAAPGRSAGSFALPMGLVLAACLVRRRRRP